MVAGAALAVLATLLFSFAFSSGPYLLLANDETDEVLLRHPVYQGQEFSVSFIHSVNQSPVREIYIIVGGKIVLTAAQFETFGAGMPTELESGQVLVRLPDGDMRIDGFDRSLTELRYMVPHGSDIILNIGERQIPLSSLDAPGQTVRFSVFQRGLWHIF